MNAPSSAASWAVGSVAKIVISPDSSSKISMLSLLPTPPPLGPELGVTPVILISTFSVPSNRTSSVTSIRTVAVSDVPDGGMVTVPLRVGKSAPSMAVEPEVTTS